MTLLQLMLDGGIAAAELLALLFISPAVAHEPATTADALERPVHLHRLTTTLDVRLLGSLADVRVAQAVRNTSSSVVDLGARLPAIDERVDSLCVVRGDDAVDLLAGNGSGASNGGHVRLSEDERIADALQLLPGASAVLEATVAQPLVRAGRFYRVLLPLRLDENAPRAVLLAEDEGFFLLLVPNRSAARAVLVLRPTEGAGETLELGAVDARQAVLVPLASRLHLEHLAHGAVELELADGATTWWSTLGVERRAPAAAIQASQAN